MKNFRKLISCLLIGFVLIQTLVFADSATSSSGGGGGSTSDSCSKYYKCPDGTEVQYCEIKEQYDENGTVIGAGCLCKTDPSSLCPETRCKDSDGGKNYYVKGITDPCYCTEKPCPTCGAWADKCLDESTLLEYSCDNLNGEKYACPNGCKDGACVKEDKCSSDSDCELVFSSCSCSWTCVKRSDKPRVDCARVCPVQVGAGKPTCNCIGSECVLGSSTCGKVCKYAGTRSEGWYNSCTGALIQYATCGTQTCVNKCGDGICQQVVCEATTCPCAETSANCPQDCTINECKIDSDCPIMCPMSPACEEGKPCVQGCLSPKCINGKCISQPQTCVGEGQKIKWDDYTSECCRGLNKINDPSGFSDDCNAMILSNGNVCAKCGDGNCGLGESKCNCPRDCSPSGIYARLNKKFELREKQEAKFLDYKNMKIRLNSIIKECYATTATQSMGETSSSGGAGCKAVGAYVQVDMPSNCVASSSNEAASCTGMGTEFVLKRGESRNVFDAEISLLGLSDNSATFIVKKNIPNDDYVDVYIEPTMGEITYGEYAKYEVTVVDKHPAPSCPEGALCMLQSYTYNIVVNNLPFLKEYPKRIDLAAGEKKSFTLVVRPYQVVEAEQTEATIGVGQSKEVEGIEKKKLEEERIRKIVNVQSVQTNVVTGGAVVEGQTTVQQGNATVAHQQEDIASAEIVKSYYEKEYKFEVRAMLLGNPSVQDSAYAVLTIKPSNPVTPPPFPTEEVEIKLYKGWNLISLPGKLVSFESNGLERKLLGFVYLKDQQRYVTIKEAQQILGDEFKEYIATNAFWVYSYTDYSLKIKIDKEISFEDIKLNPNWNLVPITEDMVGGYLSDLKGDCQFEKLYKWNALGQSWEKITENYAFNSNEVNSGIIIKAIDYCTMGGVTITTIAPPAMPE